MCVSLADGKERWSIERIWEFDRDFIGPSVWSHEIRRFGRDELEEAWHRAGTKSINVTPEDKAKVDAQLPGVQAEWRSEFEHAHVSWITGGPWVVHNSTKREMQSNESMLVAVAIAPHHSFVANLARIRLYEVDESGKVIALCDLPRIIGPDQAQSVDGLLAFACDPIGLGAVRPSAFGSLGESIMGGSDCLMSLAWYREPDQNRVEAWLQGQWIPRTAFGHDFVLRPLDGGVIIKPDDMIMTSVIERSSLSDGEHERWVFHVGLSEKPTLPTTNYSGAIHANGSEGIISSELPVPSVTLTSLRILNDYLIITLGEPKPNTQIYKLLAFTLKRTPTQK